MKRILLLPLLFCAPLLFGQNAPTDIYEWRSWIRDIETPDTEIKAELNKLKNNGTAEDLARVAFIYIYAEGFKNYEEAFQLSKKAAAAGNALGEYNMGKLYKEGFYVQQDNDKAMEWYIKSADGGDAYAMVNLGFIYQMGDGIAKDKLKAKEWYKKAADENHSLGMNNYGAMFAEEEDYLEAAYWYRKAADMNNAIAQKNLGNLYYNGEGVKKDLKKAAEWYLKAAENNYAWAQNKIGIMYEDGEGVGQDYANARYWYEQSAKQGSEWGQKNLGDLYDDGLGMKKADWEQAYKWYRMAADQGNRFAQRLVGEFYYFGVGGVARDEEQAQQWFEKAAAQDESRAQMYLAVIKDMEKLSGKFLVSKENTYGDRVISSYSYREPVVLQSPNGEWSEEVSFTLNRADKIQVWPSSYAFFGRNMDDEVLKTHYSSSQTFYESGEQKMTIYSKKPNRSLGYMYIASSLDTENIVIKLPVALCWIP